VRELILLMVHGMHLNFNLTTDIEMWGWKRDHSRCH